MKLMLIDWPTREIIPSDSIHVLQQHSIVLCFHLQFHLQLLIFPFCFLRFLRKFQYFLIFRLRLLAQTLKFPHRIARNFFLNSRRFGCFVGSAAEGGVLWQVALI